ncbi:MAG TPA: FHA domain-containing protein [Pirellulales bacterium]|nr:FHA domain-containing protein [Pirellulales bacterium]
MVAALAPWKSNYRSLAAHTVTFIVWRAHYAHSRLSDKDKRFSRVHLMIEVNPPDCQLVDADSTNGTFVNGQQLKTIDLHDGDLIEGYDTLMHMSVADVPAPIARPVIVPAVAVADPEVTSGCW